ncbi:MAG: hypothetical protein AAFX99_19015 [Myxococcota bacterium]
MQTISFKMLSSELFPDSANSATLRRSHQLQRLVVPAGEVRKMAFTGPVGLYEVVLRVWPNNP